MTNTAGKFQNWPQAALFDNELTSIYYSYFDHVPTPLSAPNPDNITVSDFDFTRLGVRVPTILISPWIEAGSVLSKPNGPQADSQFEHSSIPATIKKVRHLLKLVG